AMALGVEQVKADLAPAADSRGVGFDGHGDQVQAEEALPGGAQRHGINLLQGEGAGPSAGPGSRPWQYSPGQSQCRRAAEGLQLTRKKSWASAAAAIFSEGTLAAGGFAPAAPDRRAVARRDDWHG